MFTKINKLSKETPYAYYTYKNAYQEITFSSHGASIIKWLTPNKNGVFENIVMSYQNEADYLDNPKHLGAHVGPYAGRIYPAQLRINEKTFILDKNFLDHANLHSGKSNLQNIMYDVFIQNDNTIIFTSKKQQKDSLFPGDLDIKIIFEIKGNTLYQTYETYSNHDTVTNFTNHTYFNLSGNLKEDILNHTLKITAHLYGDLDEKFITKSLKGVSHTPFDFRKPKRLKDAIIPLKKTPQLGLDHPFLLDNKTITLHDSKSKRSLVIQTNQDTLVVYTNNFLTDRPLENGIKDYPHLAVCLETQHYPNDINFMKFPRSIHKAKTKHIQKTSYKVF
jgi:aldose 1-epimerase